MFKHLLIATDGSKLSEDGAMQAVQLAKTLAARVTVINVSIPFHVFTTNYVMISDTQEVYDKECKNKAARHLAVVTKAAESAGLACDDLHVFHEQPYVAIIEAAKRKDCDLICMASHGRKGLTALVVGSETLKVLTHSRIPVLVWR